MSKLMANPAASSLQQMICGFVVATIAASFGCQREETAPSIFVNSVVRETILTPAPNASLGRFVGVASCTASGCHGGGKPGEIVGSEYNIWISDDPHAEAFSVLYDEASLRMLQLLDGQDAVAPYADARCLACHSTAFVPPRDDRGAVYSDGVGCEACHGPAEHWLAPHILGPLSLASRAQLGMWNTDQLSSRVKICAHCHVGGPQREVNHDLIAAGHPRLQFEMGAYLEALPKHWDENRDRSFLGDKFEVLTWAVGQAITSQVALEQLARRAATGTVWPELSEWSCSACHHDLRDDQTRQQNLAKAGNLSGHSIAWDDWNHFLPRHYLQALERAFRLETSSGQTIEAEIGELQLQVQSMQSDRMEVAAKARTLATQLGRWAVTLEQATVDRRALDLLSYFIARHHLKRRHSSWASSAQAYDALASMHQSRLEMARAAGQHEDPPLKQLTVALADLYGKLASYRDTSSSESYNSKQVDAKLDAIRKILQQGIQTR